MGFLNFELFFMFYIYRVEHVQFSGSQQDTITVNVEEAEEKSHLIIAILGEKRTRVD
jgi:hypothetical protein